METKFCKKCNTNKPITEFATDKTQKDGYTRYCRECRSNMAKEYYRTVKFHKSLQYKTKNMFFPLAVIGYIELMKQFGDVTPEVVNKFVKASPVNAKKAIETIKEYLHG